MIDKSTGQGVAWSRWLPAAAMREAAPNAELDHALRTWSVRWFGSAMVRGSGDWGDSPSVAPQAGGAVWTLAGQMRLGIHPGSDPRIAELMFGKAPSGDGLTDADQQRIKAALSLCLLDLRRELSSACDADDDWSSSTPLADGWALGRPFATGTGAVLGSIALHRDLLVRRRIGVAASRSGKSLVARGEAVRDQMLRLGACVGVSSLKLSDLGALRRGDVVLLDRSIDDALDLVIEGRRVPAPCRLADAGEAFVLHLS